MKGNVVETLLKKQSCTKLHMTPSLYLWFIVYKQSLISNKDIGMVSCSFVHLCCVMTPCFFLLVLQYIPISPFEMIFPLV